MRIIFVCSFLLLFHITTHALDVYGGAGIGGFWVENLCEENATECENMSSSGRVFAGLRFTRLYAMELSLDGSSKVRNETTYPYADAEESQLLAINFNHLFFIPVSERVQIMVGAGLALTHIGMHYINEQVPLQRTALYQKDDDWDWDWGDGEGEDAYDATDTDLAGTFIVGADVRLKKWLSLRAQWQRYYDVDASDTLHGEYEWESITANAVFSF